MHANLRYLTESFRNCRATIQNPAKLKRGCEFYGSRKLITHPRFNSSPVKRDHFKRKVVFQPLFFSCHVSFEEQHLLPFGKKKNRIPNIPKRRQFSFRPGFPCHFDNKTTLKLTGFAIYVHCEIPAIQGTYSLEVIATMKKENDSLWMVINPYDVKWWFFHDILPTAV